MAVKQSLNTPSFILSALRGSRAVQMNYGDIIDTNISSTSSFYYDIPGSPLKSTQQLNVDWSKFENHVFFSSAEVKVNTAFDQIINAYPFDGTSIELEQFFEKLTGFDKWVFDQFPKYKGALKFSSGSFIAVNDFAGGLFPEITPAKSTGHSILNPKTGSLSIEAQIFVPDVTNDNQVLFAKFIDRHGYALVLSSSTSTSECQICFAISSGSSFITSSAPLQKGKFNHVCAILDRDTSSNIASIFLNEELFSSSQPQQYFGTFEIDETAFTIGSGSTMTFGLSTTFVPKETFSGSIDELRVFNSVRSVSAQKAYSQKSITASPDLKLYYRFNEPPPPLSNNDSDIVNSIVVDSSGNALHSVVTNFTGSLRIESSSDVLNPMIYEKNIMSPVLFPAHSGVVSLNSNLLASASLYDIANPNIITKLIPEHYILDGMQFDGLTDKNGTLTKSYADLTTTNLRSGQIGSTQLLLSLLYITARFFDEIKLFVDSFGTINYVNYNDYDTAPDNFLPRALKRMGFEIPPMFTDASVQQYINAENISYDISTNLYPLKYVQNQLLRRLLTNLRPILASKGTQHSIKAFLRTLGIDPENSMRFREYGGPTTRTLEFSRERKYDISTMVKFTSSSLVVSPFLSGSRTEIGVPLISGTMVNSQKYNPYGISNSSNDGLFTSGSWTYEITFKYTPEQASSRTSNVQSLCRLCGVSGSSSTITALFANLVISPDASSTEDWSAKLFLSADPTTSPKYLVLTSSAHNFFDNEKWKLSFGCVRNDMTGSIVSSSYFLRVGKADACGDIEVNFTTSSFFQETTLKNPFRQKSFDSQEGIYIALGSNQTITSNASMKFLNNSSLSSDAQSTTFEGFASNLRFWSKAITDVEWSEHIKNFKSTGVEKPTINYNFSRTQSGSFERLRLDSLNKQDVLIASPAVPSALTGTMQFIDYSQSLMHLSGTGFDANENCVKSEIFNYSYISPYYDENSSDVKVRARSFLDIKNLKDAPWAGVAPVYEIVKSEQPIDDTKFTIEFSLIDALNRDIITMFGTLDEMNNILGNPELLFSLDYPGLENLSEIYFNKLSEKLNFKAFSEFYRWFDSSIGMFIQQLVPKKTKFKGINFTIESHLLERHKLKYLSEAIYLGEQERDSLDKQIVLQEFISEAKKY